MSEGAIEEVDDAVNAILSGDEPVEEGRQPATEEEAPATEEEAPVVEEEVTSSKRPSIPADVVPPLAGEELAPITEASPPVETDVDIEEPPEVQRNPKARSAWKLLKDQVKQAKHDLTEAREQLKTKPDVSSEDVEQMQRKLSEAEDRLGKLDLAQSSAFQAQYDTPMRSLVNKSVVLLARAGRQEAEAKQMVEQLFSTSSFDELQELVANEPVAMQGALTQLVVDYQEAARVRGEALQKWQQSRAAQMETEKRNTQARLAQEETSALNSALDQLRMEGSWLFKESNRDNEWNKQVGQRVAAVQGLLKTASPVDRVRFMADGVAARTYRQMYEYEHEQNVKLQSEMNKLLGVRPKLGGGDEVVPPAAKPEKAMDPSAWLESNIT